MLYLWVFGDNVEDRFGHIMFTIFYLLCGIAATFAQLAFSLGSNVPNLGASGAIAGVLGAYILMFPKGKVRVLQKRMMPDFAEAALMAAPPPLVLALFSPPPTPRDSSRPFPFSWAGVNYGWRFLE